MSKLCVSWVWTLIVIDAQLFGTEPDFWNELKNEFNVYWNVPTFMCHRYDIYFDNVAHFEMQQNRGDEFQGDRVAILYDPGVFPALLKDTDGNIQKKNGGVPQDGNLTHHLKVFKQHVEQRITDKSFKGLGIIDFERWRPIFRQNWASLAPYRDLSREIERKKHPHWDRNDIEREAVKRYEESGKLFMRETLRIAKTLRPLAMWGYYAYPYCFNSIPGKITARCDPRVLAENDRMSWLYKLQDVILPSVYLRQNLNKKERGHLVNGRVKEALRISKGFQQRPVVLPYFSYKYQDNRNEFLSKEDVYNALKVILNQGANGSIIWGSSDDVNTKLKCQNLNDYVTNTLGPIVRDVKDYKSRISNRNFSFK